MKSWMTCRSTSTKAAIASDDLSLDIDQSGDCLGILALHVGQQPLEVEVEMEPVGLGLQGVLIGHDKRAQPVDHLLEHVGGHDAVTQQFLSPLCPHVVHLFASLE